MKKRRVIIMGTLVVALGVLGFLALRAFSGPPEPTYQGKTLSLWLSRLSDEVELKIIFLPYKSIPNEFSPVFAIRQMGTNAVPRLVHMLTGKESSLAAGFFGLARKQSVIKFHRLSERERQRQAIMGFQVLGPLASDAVPDLVWAAGNTNWDIRRNAVIALGEVHSRPELTVPALINALNDSTPLIPGNATQALGEFGPDAREAVHALVQIIETNRATFTNAGVWRTGIPRLEESAMDALMKIDPATAAKIKSELTPTRPVDQSP